LLYCAGGGELFPQASRGDRNGEREINISGGGGGRIRFPLLVSPASWTRVHRPPWRPGRIEPFRPPPGARHRVASRGQNGQANIRHARARREGSDTCRRSAPAHSPLYRRYPIASASGFCLRVRCG
jgi:hypothetical protein